MFSFYTSCHEAGDRSASLKGSCGGRGGARRFSGKQASWICAPGEPGRGYARNWIRIRGSVKILAMFPSCPLMRYLGYEIRILLATGNRRLVTRLPMTGRLGADHPPRQPWTRSQATTLSGVWIPVSALDRVCAVNIHLCCNMMRLRFVMDAALAVQARGVAPYDLIQFNSTRIGAVRCNAIRFGWIRLDSI